MRFRYASEDDELPNMAEFYGEPGDDVIIAEEDGEVLGSAIYSEDNGVGVLEYVEVSEDKRGRGIGSALVDRVIEEADAEALYSHATAMDGKIQRMLQNRGFEASGLSTDNAVSEPQPGSSGGFNLNLWKVDEEVQAYIPEELRGFAEKSLEDQREIEYLEPEEEVLTGSFDIVRSKLTGKGSAGSKKTNKLDVEIGEGSSLKSNIKGALDAVDIQDDHWAKTIRLNTTQPISHDVARTLHQKGFKPIDLSPSIDGQELTMIDLDVEAGTYSVTDETLELIDSTGLNYRIKGSDDQTTQINFLPDE